MWVIIMSLMIILMILGMIYLITRFPEFYFVKTCIQNKKKAYMISTALTLLLGVVLYITMGFVNVVTFFIHAMIFWIISDILFYFIKKLRKKDFKYYISGITASVVTVTYLGIGFYFAHHVYRTQYNIASDKIMKGDKLRIVGFSDSHIGATFHWRTFEKYIDMMNLENPDAVVILGDYIDDETSLEDMQKCSEALGQLKTKYGVYFAFGNHDAGYYAETHRGYGKKELIGILEENNVIVLEDDYVKLFGNIGILGRKDKEDLSRKNINELMQTVPDNDYVIVLDHQPLDYNGESKSGVGMVLSGHTHGGQLIPIGKIEEFFNDKVYGHEKRENTDFIVSSGISDWALKFKTGCISEYFVIDIENK